MSAMPKLDPKRYSGNELNEVLMRAFLYVLPPLLNGADKAELNRLFREYSYGALKMLKVYQVNPCVRRTARMAKMGKKAKRELGGRI